MRIVALDVGTKYIGIAITDETQTIAQPYLTYRRKGLKKDLEFFGEFLEKHNVEKIVIGYPLFLDGTESKMSLYVKKFYNKMKQKFDLEIILWDERLSTEETEEILNQFNRNLKKRKTLKDKIAAALILKDFLKNQS